MPSITVNFNNTLNTSVQLGDTLYYVTPTNITMQDSTTQPFSE